MLQALTRNKRLLLTGVLIHQAESEAEKLQTTSEKTVPDRPKESTNVDKSKVPGSGRIVEEESKYGNTKKELDAPVNGWDRVKKTLTFKTGEELNPELLFPLCLAKLGCLIGFMYGGLRDYSKAIELFLYTNDTTKFLNKNDAKRALARASLNDFMKGAILTAPKVGALCGVFGLTNIVVASYTGRDGISGYSLAGSVTTAVMKWNLGIRGMISGFVTGGLTGLIMGTMISGFLSVTGHSLSDVRIFVVNTYNGSQLVFAENHKSNSKSDVENT